MTGETGASEQSRALLEKYTPLLVIFPQEGDDLNRPGAWLPVAGTWGDYHPCSAEFLLDRVTQRDEPLPWSADVRGFIAHQRLRVAWCPSQRTGLSSLKAKAKAAGPGATLAWELDVSDLPSQDESQAWKQYARVLKEAGPLFHPTVYGRDVQTPEGHALQYWYLYMYNDFWNNHECDWEMATIVLGPDETPETVAYSQHIGGSHRKWADVKKAGGRPVLYVAKGSHAGYFDYSPDGNLPVNVNTGTAHPVLPGPLAPLDFLVSPLLKAINTRQWTRRTKDNPPADRDLDGPGVKSERYFGVRLEPELKVLPTGQPPMDADGDWWWMNLKCPWGSRHQRVFGFAGVLGPWASTQAADTRWREPVKWARETPADGE